MYFDFIDNLLNEAFEEDIKEIKDKIENEYKEKLSKELEKLRTNKATPEEITKAKQENAKEKNTKQKEEVKKFLSTKSKDDLKTTKEIVTEETKKKLKRIVKEMMAKSVEDVIKSVEEDLPSDKKYINTILTWWSTKRTEDYGAQIIPYFETFKKLLNKNSTKYKPFAKKVEYNELSFEEFKDFINKEIEEFGLSKIDEKLKGFEKIAENDTYACYKIDKWVGCGVEEKGKEKHQAFTGNIDWCVKYKDMFDRYAPPYYMFINKKTDKEYALYEPKSKQFKNTKDVGISKEEYEPIKDIAEPLIKKNNPEIFEYENKISNKIISYVYQINDFDYLVTSDLERLIPTNDDKDLEIDKKYKELVEMFRYDQSTGYVFAGFYNNEKWSKIVNANKKIYENVVEHFYKVSEIDERALPLYSYIPNKFTEVEYNQNKDNFTELGLDHISNRLKGGIKDILNNLEDFTFYTFPYYPTKIQEEIKSKYPKEYESIKFHLDNNPIMKHLPNVKEWRKENLNESLTHTQANYLLS